INERPGRSEDREVDQSAFLILCRKLVCKNNERECIFTLGVWISFMGNANSLYHPAANPAQRSKDNQQYAFDESTKSSVRPKRNEAHDCLMRRQIQELLHSFEPDHH
ncbi:hypothetical protein NPIL_415931, partial [Nephila pilipes]